ncbi:MAG: hypothetical protein KAI39_04370 [Desulfobulbaceae bacterium]|nr:hypothetical protein [Desulfobulbaceae bacterium]
MVPIQMVTTNFRPAAYNAIIKKILLQLFIFLTFLVFQHVAEAKNLISGQYVTSSGKEIILSLQILNPAPANLIVEQYLSPKNAVVSTSPKAKKRTSGKIKWLFRNTAVGRLSISIHLQSPLQGKIRGVVRYRDPVSGNFIESRISP